MCTAVVIVLFGLEHEAQPAADAVEKSTEIHQQKKTTKTGHQVSACPAASVSNEPPGGRTFCLDLL